MQHGKAPERPTPTLPPQPLAFDTLPAVVRKFRAAAARLGADGCHLFAATSAAGGRRLVPCLDLACPSSPAEAADLAERLSVPAAALAAAANAVLWWSGKEGDEPRLRGFAWAERIEAYGAAAGLALALCAEHGQHGVAIFTGDGIDTDADTLTEIHACCHALFSIVASLRPVERDAPQRISKRELECLKLTANGHTSEAISHELGLSVHTANQYLINATQKLNAVNRVHAVAKALRTGLIS